jgi:hypothetical protein
MILTYDRTFNLSARRVGAFAVGTGAAIVGVLVLFGVVKALEDLWFPDNVHDPLTHPILAISIGVFAAGFLLFEAYRLRSAAAASNQNR